MKNVFVLHTINNLDFFSSISVAKMKQLFNCTAYSGRNNKNSSLNLKSQLGVSFE